MSYLGQTDFEQAYIIDEGEKELKKGRFSMGKRDYPRYADQLSGQMGNVIPIRHPMATMGFSFSDLTSVVTSAVSNVIPQAEQAAKEALAKVAGQTAQNVVAQPAVQQAMAETAKTQATQILATKISSTGTWIANNKKMLMYGGAGLVAAFIAYKMFLSKKK